jgi:hypothetical protein
VFTGSLNVDWTELDTALGDVDERGKRLGPAFRELRKPMRGDQRAHAKAEEGPDGRWPPRSPLTEARRKTKNRAIRQTKALRTIALGAFKRRSTPKRILGRLPAAMVITVGDLFIRASSRVPWSIAHWIGDRVGHHRSVQLPVRVFYWLSDDLIEKARTDARRLRRERLEAMSRLLHASFESSPATPTGWVYDSGLAAPLRTIAQNLVVAQLAPLVRPTGFLEAVEGIGFRHQGAARRARDRHALARARHAHAGDRRVRRRHPRPGRRSPEHEPRPPRDRALLHQRPPPQHDRGPHNRRRRRRRAREDERSRPPRDARARVDVSAGCEPRHEADPAAPPEERRGAHQQPGVHVLGAALRRRS